MQSRLSRIWKYIADRFFSSMTSAPRAQIDPLESRRLLSAIMMGPQFPERAAPAAPSLPHYDHVVIVMEENHSYDQILGTPLYPPLAFPPALWPYMTMPLPFLQDQDIRSLAD